ncbi:HD-GYP domain-containing protein [Marinitoga litoralis]|uniref:HD-GYP domain-containing protein n=1 Tax=Marinitoga litoralis TaxID=570855 RepID=UPI00195FEF08|nr:HD-GYP domain-containing protein [Marinitoga litoralis]MBM7558574.1 putative nucleotidyltransferase with HDIG domain [Marinitoga litoralis]
MHFELNQNVIDNIPKLISLLESLSKENEDMDQFYNELLKTAIKIIPEADYGSLILINKNKNSWSWLSVVGHNEELLKKMTFHIKADDLIDGNVVLYDDVIEYRKKYMPNYVYNMLQKATTPIKCTLANYVKISENLFIDFSLDIDKNSEKTFSKDSKEILKLFGNIAKIFLKNKMEKNKLNELNKELKYKNYQLLEMNKKIQKMYNNALDIINNMANITLNIKDEESLLKNVFRTLVKIIPFAEKAILVEKEKDKLVIIDKIGFEKLVMNELSVKENNKNIVEFFELSGKYIQTQFDKKTDIYIEINEEFDNELFNVYSINDSLEKLIYSFSELNEKLIKTKELIKKVILAFINLSDLNEIYNIKHSESTAYYAKIIGKELGFDNDRLDKLYWAALMHDIGKIGIPSNILVKTSKLTPEEFEIVKKHTIIGHDVILKFLEDEELADIVKYHHERYDGKGYPEGLKGEEIPLESRIIAVADAYIEMTTFKEYRGIYSREGAVKVIKENKGTQFDPIISDIFINFLNQKNKLDETF